MKGILVNIFAFAAIVALMMQRLGNKFVCKGDY
jgi:hypothetical protein